MTSGEELHEVAEVDLNPVLALPDRCVAVDAHVRMRRPFAAEPVVLTKKDLEFWIGVTVWIALRY